MKGMVMSEDIKVERNAFEAWQAEDMKGGVNYDADSHAWDAWQARAVLSSVSDKMFESSTSHRGIEVKSKGPHKCDGCFIFTGSQINDEWIPERRFCPGHEHPVESAKTVSSRPILTASMGLSAPSGEVEAVEVVATVIKTEDGLPFIMVKSENPPPGDWMTVAQHQRIVAAKDADIARLEEKLVAAIGRESVQRTLAAQQAAVPDEIAKALDYVDDFIARCNGNDRGSCHSVNVLRGALAAPAAPQQGGCEYKIGIYGQAYDSPGEKRAYTYQHQPANGAAYRLGNALCSTHAMRAGDSIDSGLNLLKALQTEGFGVFELDEVTRLNADRSAQGGE